MTTSRPSLFARGDTFFGVCAGIGEDFGFSPDWLRVVFAGLLFFSPLVAVAVYAALGLAVLASRLIVPTPRVSVAAPAGAANAADEAAPALPLAA